MEKKMDLDDLIRKTVDLNYPLSSLLLEVKSVLPDGVDDEFINFLELEINGYPSADETLPEYRKSKCNSLGTFIGPFQSQIKNQPIPSHALPEEMRLFATHLLLTESISSIEELLEGDENQFGIPWPASWIANIQTAIIEDYVLFRATKPLTRGNLRTVLQNVRNKLLDHLRSIRSQTEAAMNKSGTKDDEQTLPSLDAQHEEEVPRGGIKVFISHSSHDTRFADHLVNLLSFSLSLSPKEIRCTSLDGYRLSIGSEADKELRSELLRSSVFVALISPNSIKSTYVLFEMGARWGAKLKILPLLIPGAAPELLGGPLYDITALEMSSRPQLQQFVEDLSSALNTTPESPAVYDSKIEAILAEPPINDVTNVLPYVKVDLLSVVNSSISDKYKDPPISEDFLFDGVPFEIKGGTSIFDSNAFDRTTTNAELPLQPPIRNVGSLYLLINAGGGVIEYEGMEVGEINLVFSDGTLQQTKLTLGNNIREWAIGNPFDLVKTANSQSLIEVWKGRNKDDNEAVIDVLEIPILRLFRYKELMRIDLIPGPNSGKLDFLVFAATIERLV